MSGAKEANLVRYASIVHYFSPWEVLAALGHSENAILPLSNEEAFRVVGNSIAVGHSMLCVAQMVALLNSAWPFAAIPSLSQLYDQVVGHAMKLSGLRVQQDHAFWWLVKVNDDEAAPSPSPKRLRSFQSLDVSPTLSFSVDEAWGLTGIDDHADFLCPCSIWTNLRVPNAECEGCIMILKHCNKAWCICVHGLFIHCRSGFVHRTFTA